MELIFSFHIFRGKVLKCSGCQYVYYCGRECQTNAWKIHKAECPCLKRAADKIVPDAARVMARIILKLNDGGDAEKGYYTEKFYRKFKDLMSRVSITDHSCKPNAVATFQGTTLFIRTIEDLPSTNDWSKIFISYVDLMDPTEIRRHELQKNYYFLCKCERCLDEKEPVEMNAGACSNAKCNEFIDFESLKKYPTNCKKCDERITAKHYQQFKDVMHATRMHLDSMKMSSVAYLDICSILVKRQRGVLHRMNIWFLKTLDLAFESAIDFEKWNEALEYGIELLPGFRKYNGDFNPLLGLLHMKVGKIQLFTNNSKEALHNLNKASDIIKITHGEDHNLYRNELVPLLIQAACESEPNSDRNSDQK
ncbi:histone-lysine N-methyltransferase SMYD3 isoform X2 [Sitodiplosis mosellana]|uniref:histone-lysine N-methyltransferase SMYD3 isoform X2 n=1 Tax=Sitodiplosis mosellana TaxID=263140 RepID=UPI002443C415|nr:histone-lysine N-methyltransferase SMYD3 isoform X2 [Sitodiplosis mosellana]